MRSNQAFVQSAWPLTQRSQFVTSHVCSRSSTLQHVNHPRPQQSMPVTMETKGTKEKKRSITFATDMKGNIVWTMRGATTDDTDAVCELVGDGVSRDQINSFLTDSKCSTVCEASIKGSQDGEAYKSLLLGVALVDVGYGAKDVKKGVDSELVKKADFLTLKVHDEMPELDVPKKLVLGSLKKMKEDGVNAVSHLTTQQDRVNLLTECGFTSNGKNEDGINELYIDLTYANPDPRKKMN